MGVPETYIIDKDGYLRHMQIGPFSSLQQIKSVVEAAFLPLSSNP